ncbi:hypothetical protein EZ456_20790 [Pedobacter psychrodurus]|uniref:Uncharacterized protein n=1 Tax=Pedobacter psychrodurus TaxID=2530456 RepID=A0A4R0PIE5_9SPHI|nr:hypothetical protein [Pedobacter psychrodurus]TCD18936.1 hypothetical protein EZ456_20790 [Pedobacter psychrodurus]
MNRLIRQDLSKITLDEQGLPAIGNYASLKYSEEDTKIALNASFANPFKKTKETDPIRWVLSANIKAGVSDGISSLFENKNASSGTGIKLKASFLSRKTQYVNESQFNCTTTKLYRSYLYKDYNMAMKDPTASVAIKRNEFNTKIEKFSRTIAALDMLIIDKKKDIIDSLELARLALISDEVKFLKDKNIPLLDTNLTPEQLKAKLLHQNERTAYELNKRRSILDKQFKELPDQTIASLIKSREDADNALTLLRIDFRKFETEKVKLDSANVIDNTYAQLLAIETKDIKWDYFKVKWFDIDVSLSGDTYKMYTANTLVTEKLDEKNFSTWSVGFSGNYFQSGRADGNGKNGYFFKWGYYISNDNNFDGTTPKEVVNTITKEENGVKREIISKTKAFEGPLVETFSHNAAVHWSKYLNVKQSTSFNLYSTAKFGFEDNPTKIEYKPDWMIGTGVTFSLLNKDKATSFLNLQLFLNFSDVLNVEKDEKTQFYDRHQLGIKIGIPFNSIFL